MSQPIAHVFEPSLSHRVRKSRRKDSPLTTLAVVILGAATAYFICAQWLPAMSIHADAAGRWERVEIDWNRTMLGGER